MIGHDRDFYLIVAIAAMALNPFKKTNSKKWNIVCYQLKLWSFYLNLTHSKRVFDVKSVGAPNQFPFSFLKLAT